jgi:hypothetical protein
VAPRSRGDGILHPVTLGALGLLLLNDHVLKAAYPGLITGKLSDVAGMIFFPSLLVALGEVVLRLRSSRALVVGCVCATGFVFALTKSWEPAADVYRVALGLLQAPFRGGCAPVRFVCDPTDLVALPALLVPLTLELNRQGRQARQGIEGVRP